MKIQSLLISLLSLSSSGHLTSEAIILCGGRGAVCVVCVSPPNLLTILSVAGVEWGRQCQSVSSMPLLPCGEGRRKIMRGRA